MDSTGNTRPTLKQYRQAEAGPALFMDSIHDWITKIEGINQENVPLLSAYSKCRAFIPPSQGCRPAGSQPGTPPVSSHDSAAVLRGRPPLP